MDGDFLKDLSTGIFSRLGELRKEQETRDEEKRMQTIQLLSGLAGQVEPESLPALMRHLGDVVGVRGKLKGFWNSFSGMPDQSVEQQLAEKLKEVSSALTGPATARQSRETYKQELLQPFRATGTRPRSVEALPYRIPPDLRGKIIFRDPQQAVEAARQFEADQLDKRLSQQSLIEEQKERLRSSLEERREQAKTEGERRRQEAREQAQQLRDARTYAARYWSQGVSPEIAKQLGDYLAGINDDLPPSVEGLVRPSASRTRISRGSGVGRMERDVELFERTKEALIDATSRGDEMMMTTLRKRLQASAANLAAKYGDRLEVGGGDWPYLKSRGQQTQASGRPTPVEGMYFNLNQPQESQSISRMEAKKKLKDNGYSDAEAEQELNRLGIR